MWDPSGGAGNPLFPPFCRCDRNLERSPYRAVLSSSTRPGSLCFTMTTVDCDPKFRCCNADLYKFELQISECPELPLLLSCADDAQPSVMPIQHSLCWPVPCSCSCAMMQPVAYLPASPAISITQKTHGLPAALAQPLSPATPFLPGPVTNRLPLPPPATPSYLQSEPQPRTM